MTHTIRPYVAYSNTPGYLPDSDGPAATFDTAEEAWEYLATERRDAEDDTDLDGYSATYNQLDAMGRGEMWGDYLNPLDGTGTVVGPTPGYDGRHDLGVAYTVTRTELPECTYTDSANHSDDRLEVYTGRRGEPTIICGYHHESRGVPQRDPDGLDAAVEFDSPFRVMPNGSLGDHYPIVLATPANPQMHHIYAPEVYHVDGKQHPDDVEVHSDEWETFSVGYTGQYSYNGAVMHPSEYIGGRLADDILASPGVYVVVSVEVPPHEVRITPVEAHEFRHRTECDTCGTVLALHITETEAEERRDAHIDYHRGESAGWTILKLKEF